MLIQDFLPTPELNSFVRCYRVVHFESDGPGTIPPKSYAPKPEQCLHFFLHDQLAIQTAGNNKIYVPPILFTGQATSLVNRFHGHRLLDVQIVFQPMAVYRLTGMPAYILTDEHLDAASIFNHHIHYVFQQLQESTNYSAMIYIIEKFAKELVNGHCREWLPLDQVIRQMMLRNGNISVDWMARESCLSLRQFRRKFYERTGVNPKTYLRIMHFNKAFNYKNRFPEKEWSAIAAACGYADYQHLVKDYQAFTGLTPPALHLLENKAPEHVFGLTKPLYHTRFRGGY